MPTVEWNRKTWGKAHSWDKNGDEWSFMAAYCGQPYEEWKSSLIDTLLAPGASRGPSLEIGPGHGRWTEHLLERSPHVWIVDVNENCLDHCRERFADHPGLPRTFDVGPGNADIMAIPQENILQSNEQLRHAPDARTKLDLSHRDLRQIRLHLRPERRQPLSWRWFRPCLTPMGSPGGANPWVGCDK
jgi:hypothetical protein